MGWFVLSNAVLIGAFSFASLHHLVLWRVSRTRLRLLIAIYCGVSAGMTLAIVEISSARSLAAAQRAVDARVVFGLLGMLSLAWLVATLTNSSPRRYLQVVSALLVAGVVLTLLGFPLIGRVIGLVDVTMPWGEHYQILQRTAGATFMTALLYAAATSVSIFAIAAGVRLARQDRLAGWLIAAAGAFGIGSAILGLLIDLQFLQAPYVGQIPNALWILLITILVSREHSARETRLELSEQALIVSEARFRTLIESAPEAIVVHDVEANIFVDANPEACRLFAATADQLRQLSPVDVSAPIQPDGLTAALAAAEYIRQAASGSTPVFEWLHRTLDGRDVPCEVRLVRLPDPKRLILRGSITDISERRLLEDQLRQSQKMEAIGQLAGGVAHDFNNLLTVISGYAEILRSQLPDPDPRSGLVKAIGDTAERAGWLTARLLAFGRRAVLTPQVFDLNELVGDGEHILRRLIGEHIGLRVSRSPAPLHVKIDPGQWSQLMLNLAINARDAMPAGGSLSLRTFVHDVDGARADRGLAPGHYAVFAMSDTGLGMSPDIRARIFEPFFTTKELGKGTGLGLAVVHGIVTQAGGAIDVDTVPNRGTTFTVYLPAADGAPAPAPSQATLDSLGAGETLLLVEDEAALREMLEASLSARGFRVLGACDGDDAMRILDTPGLRVDLLVTDMVMPGRYNGRQLADVVRERCPGLKVLFISGYIDDPQVRVSGFNHGEQCLQKPFSLAAIARKAREILDAA